VQLIHCTKKLQKEMGLRKSDLSEIESADSRLGSWHANLLFVDRRKCVLFVNDKTLFNFLVPDVSRASIRQLRMLFLSSLELVIVDEKLSTDVLNSINAEYEELGLGNTHNRSVLGSMNDLAFHYKYHVHDQGGLHRCDLRAIIRQLNRMPMGAIAFAYPIERLKALYGYATHERF
jgi:hypothetical protein